MTGRLRAVGWSLIFLGGGFVLALLLIRVVFSIARPAPGGALFVAAVQTGGLLVVYVALTWVVGRRALGLSAADLGLRPARQGVRGFARGLALGSALAAGSMLLAVGIGHASWRGDGGTPAAWLGALLLTAAVLLPAALVEELMFRGVPMVALSRGFGRGVTLGVLALAFAAVHLLNEGISPLALVNIALAGLFLGLAFWTPGGLWTSTGAHFGWNLTLAGLAAPVSGLLLPMPWMDYADRGPSWLTGGGFGPEGGILASLALAAGAVLASRRMTRETLA